MTANVKQVEMAMSCHCSRRQFLDWSIAIGATVLRADCLAASIGLPSSDSAEHALVRPESKNPKTAPKPNVIIILCDNLGYGDVGCFGSRLHRTPNIDGMARQGVRLTDFYATSGVCTPSRASLMTGCYPRRVSMHVADNGRPVLSPISKKGLNPQEITIAELLSAQG